ncbi:MAG: hypothetical protein Solivirus1_22 [Solivirus sp.]|uniref:Uncharacterized protein n=1 Tax=Solivirus sp. TaxID=2487772 RepID=A0A3G5AF70_9VIRU|nr:MAG: hypothetical protein Solivirus1_22 [Solivirus sp.]
MISLAGSRTVSSMMPSAKLSGSTMEPVVSPKSSWLLSVQQVQLALRVSPARLANRAQPVSLARLDLPVLEQLASLARLVQLAAPAQLEAQHSAQLVRQVSLVPPASQATLAQPVQV